MVVLALVLVAQLQGGGSGSTADPSMIIIIIVIIVLTLVMVMMVVVMVVVMGSERVVRIVRRWRGTHNVRRAGTIRMAGAVGGASGSVAVQTVTQLGWFRTLPIVDHQIDRHLALQAADIPMAKVVAELVYLKQKRIKRSLAGTVCAENQLEIELRNPKISFSKRYFPTGGG